MQDLPDLEIDLDRYLVPFQLRHVPQYRFDVVVLGSGAGGSLAALAAAERGATVAVVAKDNLSVTNTAWAQGGVAAVLSTEDSFESHVHDTLEAGRGLSEVDVVRQVIQGGPAAIERLRVLGARFDRRPSGDLELSREGGHSFARIVHAQGDATGREIQGALVGALERHPDIDLFSHVHAIDLLSDEGGAVVGVLCRTSTGELVSYIAPQIILATGGGGQIWRETTNPPVATADGLAMAVRAGASVRDLEFVQFHPTLLYIAGAARVLISEIVRGAGAVLRDKHGVRFMPTQHAMAELAPRDVVSRAVFHQMVETDDTSVYLDLSGLAEDPHALFPGISRICNFFGIDIARDPVPVRPGAHYMIGGLVVDGQGRTNVPGLWAVGECASTGLHGANRMGSNSLLEAVVLGDVTGQAAADAALRSKRPETKHVVTRERTIPPPGVEVNLSDLTYSLKSLMWRQMGVVRTASGMQDALGRFEFWARAIRALPMDDARAVELVNMLTIARLSTVGALTRVESRGAHHRSDYPEVHDDWCAHLQQTPVVDFISGRVRRVALALKALGSHAIEARL
ncbi:MAG: L-aspartate oxidase [Planctomycetota bacterium]